MMNTNTHWKILFAPTFRLKNLINDKLFQLLLDHAITLDLHYYLLLVEVVVHSQKDSEYSRKVYIAIANILGTLSSHIQNTSHYVINIGVSKLLQSVGIPLILWSISFAYCLSGKFRTFLNIWLYQPSSVKYFQMWSLYRPIILTECLYYQSSTLFLVSHIGQACTRFATNLTFFHAHFARRGAHGWWRDRERRAETKTEGGTTDNSHP